VATHREWEDQQAATTPEPETSSPAPPIQQGRLMFNLTHIGNLLPGDKYRQSNELFAWEANVGGTYNAMYPYGFAIHPDDYHVIINFEDDQTDITYFKFIDSHPSWATGHRFYITNIDELASGAFEERIYQQTDPNLQAPPGPIDYGPAIKSMFCDDTGLYIVSDAGAGYGSATPWEIVWISWADAFANNRGGWTSKGPITGQGQTLSNNYSKYCYTQYNPRDRCLYLLHIEQAIANRWHILQINPQTGAITRVLKSVTNTPSYWAAEVQLLQVHPTTGQVFIQTGPASDPEIIIGSADLWDTYQLSGLGFKSRHLPRFIPALNGSMHLAQLGTMWWNNPGDTFGILINPDGSYQTDLFPETCPIAPYGWWYEASGHHFEMLPSANLNNNTGWMITWDHYDDNYNNHILTPASLWRWGDFTGGLTQPRWTIGQIQMAQAAGRSDLIWELVGALGDSNNSYYGSSVAVALDPRTGQSAVWKEAFYEDYVHKTPYWPQQNGAYGWWWASLETMADPDISTIRSTAAQNEFSYHASAAYHSNNYDVGNPNVVRNGNHCTGEALHAAVGGGRLWVIYQPIWAAYDSYEDKSYWHLWSIPYGSEDPTLWVDHGNVGGPLNFQGWDNSIMRYCDDNATLYVYYHSHPTGTTTSVDIYSIPTVSPPTRTAFNVILPYSLWDLWIDSRWNLYMFKVQQLGYGGVNPNGNCAYVFSLRTWEMLDPVYFESVNQTQGAMMTPHPDGGAVFWENPVNYYDWMLNPALAVGQRVLQGATSVAISIPGYTKMAGQLAQWPAPSDYDEFMALWGNGPTWNIPGTSYCLFSSLDGMQAWGGNTEGAANVFRYKDGIFDQPLYVLRPGAIPVSASFTWESTAAFGVPSVGYTGNPATTHVYFPGSVAVPPQLQSVTWGAPGPWPRDYDFIISEAGNYSILGGLEMGSPWPDNNHRVVMALTIYRPSLGVDGEYAVWYASQNSGSWDNTSVGVLPNSLVEGIQGVGFMTQVLQVGDLVSMGVGACRVAGEPTNTWFTVNWMRWTIMKLETT